jgi:hypothetical protein
MAFLEVAGGAVLGGALALGTTWFFEQRRERREDARERAALKAAARIAYTDMGVIRRNLRQAVKEGRWHMFMEMPLSGWQQQGHRLAGSLPPQDYDSVAQAFARAGDLERGFRELLPSTAAGVVAGARVVPFRRTRNLNSQCGISSTRRTSRVRSWADSATKATTVRRNRTGWEALSHHSEIAAATRSAANSSDCGKRCA